MVTTKNAEGPRLAEFRKMKGLTQTEFAELLGCSQPSLFKIEKGAIGISSQLRTRLFEAFPELSPNWLDRGLGRIYNEIPFAPTISEESQLTEDLTSRFMSSINKFEQMLEQGKLPHDTIIVVFRNLRKIVEIQEAKIKDLEEDKSFLKSIVVSARTSPFKTESAS